MSNAKGSDDGKACCTLYPAPRGQGAFFWAAGQAEHVYNRSSYHGIQAGGDICLNEKEEHLFKRYGEQSRAQSRSWWIRPNLAADATSGLDAAAILVAITLFRIKYESHGIVACASKSVMAKQPERKHGSQQSQSVGTRQVSILHSRGPGMHLHR